MPEPDHPGARPPGRARRWPLFAAISALGIVAVLAAILLLRPKAPVAAAAAVARPAVVTTAIEVTPPRPTTTTAVVIEPVDKPATGVKTADDFYNEGLARLVERQPFRARDAFATAVELDPSHARAHFRLGEMALFGRDFGQARTELSLALEHAERLDERERKLTELGLAVLDRDRERANALVQELSATSPNDPDLMRFRELVDGGQRRVRPD